MDGFSIHFGGSKKLTILDQNDLKVTYFLWLITLKFKSTLANFCKSKKCIIFNVDYRPGSKMSTFYMTLIS